MTKADLNKLEKIAKQLYKNNQTFKQIAEVLELTLTDVIYLILADQKSKQQRFKAVQSDFIKTLRNGS